MWTWLATHAIAAANQRSCCCSCNHCDSRRGNSSIDPYRLCVTVCWHSRPASRLRGGTASSAGATTKPRRRIVFHQRRPPPTDDSSHLFCLPPTSPDSIPSPTGFDNLGPDTTEDIPDSGMRLLCPPYTGEGQYGSVSFVMKLMLQSTEHIRYACGRNDNLVTWCTGRPLAIIYHAEASN